MTTLDQNRTLIIEKGAINKVESLLKKNPQFKKVLYVTTEILDKLCGDILKKQIQNVVPFHEELMQDNTIQYAMDLSERIIATDISCIIGFGGGRVLETTKYVSYITKIPLIAIPTTCATDGIASPIAILKKRSGRIKNLVASVPQMILLDLDLISKAPIEYIHSGICDVISNYTALLDWDNAIAKGKEESNGYGYILSKTALNDLMKTTLIETTSIPFLEVLVNSLVLSGIAMECTGSSRPVSGPEHLFSRALDFYLEKPALHGLQVALGSVSVLKLLGLNCKEIVAFLKKHHVNINPSHLHISEETFVLAFQNATKMRDDRYTYLNEMDLNETKLKKVYKELLEEL